MRYKFQYNKSKVLQALRLHFITRPEVKMLAYAVNIFAIIAAVMYGLHKIRPQAFLLCATLWIALVVIFLYVMPNIIYKKGTKTFHDIFSADFDTQGIDLENGQGSVHWDWARFSNYFESYSFFHLYFNSRSFFIFPKDGMNSEMLADVRVLLKDNVREGKV